MRFSCHKDFTELRDVWRTLWRDGIATPYENITWCEAWLASSQKYLNCSRIVLAQDEAGAAALFPFRIEYTGGLRRVTWLSQGPSCHHAPVMRADIAKSLSPDQARRLMQMACEAAGPADYAFLPRQPIRIEKVANPFGLAAETLNRMRTHAVRLDPNPQTALAAAFRKLTRKRFDAFERRLQAEGRYRLERIGAGPAAATVAACIGGWKLAKARRGGIDTDFSAPAYRAFLQAFLEDPEAPAAAAYLAIDGVPVAAALLLERPGRDVVYHLAYDLESAWVSDSPGRLLLSRMLRQAVERGAEEFDLTIGDEPYKRSICDLSETLRDARIALTPAGAVRAFLERSLAKGRSALTGDHPVAGAARRLLRPLRRASPTPNASEED